MTKPSFFKTPKDFRNWLEHNHGHCQELWVGFYRKSTKIPSITWSESVDQALCFGWIDGLRKKIDDKSYMIRFTPRRVNSHWSAVNLKKMKTLKEQGLLRTAGLEAFQKMDPNNILQASYEKKVVQLAPELKDLIRHNKKAWAFFQNLPPGYKRRTIHWVMSAKREATRLQRIQVVIESAAQGLRIPILRK